MRHAVGLSLLLALAGPAAADVTITATTAPAGGPYDPDHVVAVWIESSAGTFVKTIQRHAGVRKQHLVAWTQKAGPADADAVSGATRQSHATPLSITWNLRDKTGALVPDGTYTVRMELADANSNQAAQNNQGTFTFVKGAAPQVQTALANGNFSNVSIDFQPVADTCNNGAVDSGETCDPTVADSCPASCPQSLDACQPNNLVGAAASCSAECVVQPITACASGDGCCPEGCEGDDDDCDGGGGGAVNDIEGGCATGRGTGFVMLIAVLLGLAARRRR